MAGFNEHKQKWNVWRMTKFSNDNKIYSNMNSIFHIGYKTEIKENACDIILMLHVLLHSVAITKYHEFRA